MNGINTATNEARLVYEESKAFRPNCSTVRTTAFILLLGVVLNCGCARSIAQQFSNDESIHPIVNLPAAEYSTVKQIFARELAEPKHAVGLDVDLPWVEAHRSARMSLAAAGYVTDARGTLDFTQKARREATRCGKAGNGISFCHFVIARESIVSFDAYKRIAGSVAGYIGTDFFVTVTSKPTSPIGSVLLRSRQLTCLPSDPKSARVAWHSATQQAFDTLSLPAPVRADKEYGITVSGCPTLEDLKGG